MATADNGHTVLATDVVETEPETVMNNTEKGELTVEVAAQFAEKYSLNDAQSLAFKLIVKNLINSINSEKDEMLPKNKPLWLILHGPGGTGKTHSLQPIQDMLDHVGIHNVVVRLAPTGSAAALIDGQTIHSALKLKITKRNKTHDEFETLEIMWSAEDKKKLQDELGSAKLILVDEFSLLAVNLLAQPDAGVKLAKQNFEEWFGGTSVVLSGDLCQYAPVGGKPLYYPISSKSSRTDKTGLEKFGRLANLGFEDVIEFHKQHHMKNDPEYGEAVLRL